MRLNDRQARRARAIDDNLDVFDAPAGQLTRIEQTGGGDDGGAVLVVMENRNVEFVAQAAFDDEAFGALDVLRLMPPNVGPILRTVVMSSSGSCVVTSMSMLSTSAKRLNRTALPSITGFDAAAPRLPRPRIAVPLEITATRLPFAV